MTMEADQKADPEPRRPILVRLAPVLMRLFPDATSPVSLEAASIREMVAALDERWPGMGDCICDESPAIRRHINVFVDGERRTLDTPLKPGADVFILTAISGG